MKKIASLKLFKTRLKVSIALQNGAKLLIAVFLYDCSFLLLLMRK